MGERTKSLLALNQRRLGFDRVALDYEHNTLPGTAAHKASTEPRPVAAYGTPELREDGLYLTDIVYTPDGIKNARNFCDLSAAPELDENGEVVFLHSVGLVRQGSVFDISFFSVDMPMVGESGNQNATQEKALMEKIMSLLRKMAGKPENCSDEDLAAGLMALNVGQQIVALNATITDLNKKIAGEKKEAGAPELVALNATVADLATKVAAFNAEIEKRDREAICLQAQNDGKVIPLSVEQIAATPVATLKDMVGKIKPTVPLSARTPANVQEFSAGEGTTLTDLDKKVAAKMGFSEEDVKKSNGLK